MVSISGIAMANWSGEWWDACEVGELVIGRDDGHMNIDGDCSGSRSLEGRWYEFL